MYASTSRMARRIIRTNSDSQDFQGLVRLLDLELKTRDGDLNSFYHQFNGIEALQEVVVLYEGEQAIACGAFKAFDRDRAELKRMYVREESRGQGFAAAVLKELESWALELGLKALVLETGQKQTEAIQLYQKHQYIRIPNYPPYDGVENSLCFEKKLS